MSLETHIYGKCKGNLSKLKHAILNCLNARLQLKWKTILNISKFIISQIQSNFYLVINYNCFGCLLIVIFDNIVSWF